MEKIENVIIIGGGPAGLSAALYLARAGLEPLVVAGSPAGGQLMLTTEVENFPGIKSILGPELVASMRANAGEFGTRYLDENVTSIQHENGLKVLTANQVLSTKTILIATGAKAKWLGIPSEKLLMGRGVSACATCDGFFFRGKKVAVVGGGDTAMEEALTLTNFATEVHLLHRREEFRASEIMQQRVKKHAKIQIHTNVAVEEILGEQKVEGVRMVHLENGQATEKKSELYVDGVFIAIGHTPDSKFLQGSGIAVDEKGYVVDRQMSLWRKHLGEKLDVKFPSGGIYKHETNIPGIFVSGDVSDPYYRQASTASGTSVEASLEIEWALREME